MKFNTLIPELSVTDLEKSLKFYVEILGFVVEYRRDEDRFALISLEGAQLILEEGAENPWDEEDMVYPFGRGITFSIEVGEVDPLVELLRENCGELKREVEERWYPFKGKLLGEKQFSVVDPDGYLLRIIEDLGEKKIKEKI